MATITRASVALPVAGDDINAEPITDQINNILTFIEATNIDENNVNLTASNGIMGISTAQTVTGQKTFNNIIAISTQNKSTKIQVYNNTGASIAAGDLLYISNYNSTQSLYEVTKAVVTTSPTTSLYAVLIADAAIANAAAGNACTIFPLTAVDTSGLTVGRPVFLSTTAGAWRGTIPAAGNAVQIVGFVATVNASTGRIILTTPGSIIPWSLADQI